MKYFLIHGSCPDGFMAGYCAWLRHKNEPFKMIQCFYNQPFPIADADLPKAEIVIMDFSYPKNVLEHVFSLAKSLKVLDHHKTAQDQLSGLSFAHFDMNKSGAMLAWDHFFPNQTPPKLVQYVQDRDLWKFELLSSKEVNAVIQSYDMGEVSHFETFKTLADRLENAESFNQVVSEGTAILRFQNQFCKMAISRSKTMREIDGHKVPVVNTSVFESEIGNALLNLHPEAPFAATCYEMANGEQEYWSLRSRGDFNVGELALKLGGGGHPAAAAFKKKKV